MVFGPRCLQGLGYKRPYYLQIIIQIGILMKHWGRPTITGGLIQVEWEALVQCAGLAGSPSDWDWDVVHDYIPTSWLGDLVSLARKEGIEIALHNLRLQPTSKDRTIMGDLIIAGYKGKTLRVLNEVRLSKQLFWVSDLVTAPMDY